MELLNPSHPPHPHHAAPTSILHLGFHRVPSSVQSQIPQPMEERACKVHVAVGKSLEKTVNLLKWTFNQFRNTEIIIIHVYQPSLLIPTLSSQANPEVVSAFRRDEREQIMRLLNKCLSICRAAKVKASIIVTEADQVQKGIVDLVIRNNIRKLVIGAVPENWMKMKRNSSKANYAAKNAPPFCEIWFICKGKHICTREASETSCSLSSCTQPEIVATESLRCESSQYGKNELFHSEYLQSNSATTTTCSRIRSWVQGEIIETEATFSSKSSNCNSHCSPQNSSGVYLDTYLEVTEESINSQLAETKREAEAATDEAFEELLKCKRLEVEAMDAIRKVNFFESAVAREVKLRKEAEDALRVTVQEQQKILDESEEIAGELQMTMRNITLLDSHFQEANRRRNEAADELSLIQASISTLWQERQQIRRQKMEALRWLERWKSRGQVGAAHCNGVIGFAEDLPELAEFSLSDLQNATCNFSESFKIRQGGYGCIYKGEMLGRTVAIRKFHPHNTQVPAEFYQEVQVLGCLQHPHLLTLLGVCPEAWSIVYEYAPNGNLQDYLFRKRNNSPLPWNTRARMIAEIASALCFLHSSKPETIIHGDLKPETILLDSSLSCKICEFGFCRLVTEESLYRPSFRLSTEPKGAFTYTDPEFQRTGILTPKSDIYSFGIIILQLLTGRTPVGLTVVVRSAVSCGKMSSILDSSAGEWPSAVATRLFELGLQCCQLNRRDRPELTPTLVRELEQLHVSEERPVPSFFLCPILQEIMHDPQVAADGFTYEGDAIREWLENGHNTSPMTNLKLSHLLLTPNHALRLAIQDWLCKS
ncbi:U-box domain-containing protein 33-like isoform X2 [Gastrolobium bilobum]|uniref:U-box domain-containing protein 33-like isoform X2 n=1 Tax=Gastrolobium bilobum TaxID=150636 RepID=UPI002AB30386|nr:U-box domain-containing protein 33-like isoform X2 [Gastrolobium bilobum]